MHFAGFFCENPFPLTMPMIVASAPAMLEQQQGQVRPWQLRLGGVQTVQMKSRMTKEKCRFAL